VPPDALGPGYVSFEELRRLLRLAGELRDLPPGSPEQRRHALDGLAAVVGAQVGLCVECALASVDDGGLPRSKGALPPPKPPASLRLLRAVEVGWTGERERDAFSTYVREAQERSLDPSLPRLARQLVREGQITRTRAELVGDRAWYRSEHVNEFRRTGGVDSFIFTGALTGPRGEAIGITLHRAWGDRGFGERERRVVEVFQEVSGWLHHRPPPAPADLPPRLRDTLAALAEGLSEKQVAERLRLSPHTVHEYTKALYRRFGVQSRAELLARHLGRG
jgi:DNA-binding CsgD family transcriptional regulator